LVCLHLMNVDLSSGLMHASSQDLAQVRLDNALALFEEFVRATARHADAATLRGLEGRFAERIQIQPSYWSQIKSRSRQIGERLARQFETLCNKPNGWMDTPHGASTGANGNPSAGQTDAAGAVRRNVAQAATLDNASESSPRDDDERFIVGLVLTYYRRHPQRARTRLLDLLGEVLSSGPAPSPAAALAPTGAGTAARAARSQKSAAPDTEKTAAEDPRDLWLRTQTGVAPLKRKP